MQSIKIDIFFSASFDPVDDEVNKYFAAICDALDINMENVSFGAPRTPDDQAKKMIERSQGLIAICTKREELKDGTFNMPQAVNDEIAIACGMGIPVVAIVEKGVNRNGFKEKYNTYLEFDRKKISTNELLKKAIKTIHEFKLDVIGPHQISSAYELSDSHAEELSHLVELKHGRNGFFWEYSTTKKIVFTEDSKRPIPTSVFSTQEVNIPAGAEKIHWEYEQLESSGSLNLVAEIEEQSASCVEVRLRPEPQAEKNDYVKYRTFAKHKYLIPLWDEDISKDKIVHLDKGDFKITDGLLFIHRTKKAVLEFRFCREYGLKKSDIVPFVASYTSRIDFEVQSELDRSKIRIEDFGGSLTIRMEMDSALPGHLYGIAWNPKPKPD